MANFSEEQIRDLFKKNLGRAKKLLTKLPIFCGEKDDFSGLHGWVFEKTIQYCIREELKTKGIRTNFQEEINLGGRSRVDLVVGKTAIEIKLRGLFSSNSIEKYRNCKTLAKKQGYNCYIYLTLGESYRPYREGIINVLGKENTFFLDEAGEWTRFIDQLIYSLK